MYAGVLQSGLDVIEEMLGLERFRMAPVEPAEEVFSGATRPHADLPERCLEGRVIAEAASTERLLDRVVEVMALELRDPPGAIAPHAREPQDLTLAHADAEEDREDLEEAHVFFSHVLVGCRARQPERDVDAFEQPERDLDLLAQLVEGSVRAWGSSPSRFDIPEGQIP
ncbi:MAG: hypothetical protein ACXWFU_13280 [Actinomycetota bacterium]